jgi:pimeloyl-ACP methyl ester carboxylesterase
MRDRYDSLLRIGKVRAPVLVVVAERDEVISRERSDALIAAIPPGIGHVVVIAGATHNDIDTFPAYLARLKEFVAQ